MKVFHLKFTKEADGDWYIDFPGYPFAHHNLMMVAGANLLCEHVAVREGHPDLAVIDVTLDGDRLDGRQPDIIMTRKDQGYGATYTNALASGLVPAVQRGDHELTIDEAWICPVTLLVLFRYPKNINIYLNFKD